MSTGTSLNLNIPPDKQPHGTAFDKVDNFNLHKDNTPAGRLHTPKCSLGSDPVLSEAQQKQRASREL